MAKTQVTKAEILNEAATQYVTADEATSSTSFTDLATPGPAVTVDIGPSGKALILITAGMYSTVAPKSCGVALSGATTAVADAAWAARYDDSAALRVAGHHLLTGLNPGATTFTCKYSSASAGGRFFARELTVIPL
jgi:hypothetical protein